MIAWSPNGRTKAEYVQDGSTKSPLAVKGYPKRTDPRALPLSRGVTLAPMTVQAAWMHCGTTGQCLLLEREEKMAERGVRLHNALADLTPGEDQMIFLSNLTGRPINLPKNFYIRYAAPYYGPAFELPDDDPGPDVGADNPVCTLGSTTSSTEDDASEPDDDETLKSTTSAVQTTSTTLSRSSLLK